MTDASNNSSRGNLELTAATLTKLIVENEGAAGKPFAKDDILVVYVQCLRKVQAFSERIL